MGEAFNGQLSPILVPLLYHESPWPYLSGPPPPQFDKTVG